MLAPTRDAVRAKHADLKAKGTATAAIEPILNRAAAPKGWPKDRPFLVHNTSKLDFATLKQDPENVARNLTHFIKGFNAKFGGIFDHFGFGEHIEKLDKANRLYQVVAKFAEIDLHPDIVSNTEMGYVFEELIRKFNEAANETAGDHFTPREVIRLIVNVLFDPDDDGLRKPGVVRTLCDPACGTGGMLSVSEEYLRELNPGARLEVFGQDFNPESYAICGSDMLIKGQDIERIRFGDSFTEDGFRTEQFDYLLANPPFGVEWKPAEDAIRKERADLVFGGRFGAGVPRINDGSLLFLQHMISKMKTVSAKAGEGGSRIGIVFNGSPLFTGDAGSGESEIRRWIIKNDWLEAIIALPDQLFYNTGIFTYVWIVTNRKAPERRGKVQLVNAVSFFQKMRKSLGNKRNEIGDGREGRPDHIGDITRLYGEFQQGPHSKIFDNEDFGYRKITVERPLRLRFEVTEQAIVALRDLSQFKALAESKKKDRKERQRQEREGVEKQDLIVAVLRTLPIGKVWMSREAFVADLEAEAAKVDLRLASPIRKAIVATFGTRDETAEICVNPDGTPEPDPDLRDFEHVPLKEDINVYFDREVRPHVPDAWISTDKRYCDKEDHRVGIVGYELPFTSHFYEYVPPRPLKEIEMEIKALESDIVRMLTEVTS